MQTNFTATNRRVIAYIDVPGTFVGYNLGFDTRDKLLTFVRALKDTFKVGQLYGGGFDRKGEFLVMAGRGANGRPKLVIIDTCDSTREEAA